MRGRIGWWALVVLSAVLLISTALGGAVAVVIALRDGDVASGLAGAASVALGVLFWRWILLGAWLRIHPPAGVVPSEADPVGPWGVVGRAMLGVMLLGFLGLWLWVALVGSRAVERAEAARDEAVRLARDRDLTAADVQAALSVAGFESGYADLLPLTEGTIASLAADGDRASILIRVDGSPPCAVVDITHDDIIRGRLTDRC